jgi:hypothetical protein
LQAFAVLASGVPAQNLDIRLIETPTHTHRALAAAKRFLGIGNSLIV